MSELKIQIIGPCGSGKTLVANLLRFQLENSVKELEVIDDAPRQQNWQPTLYLGRGVLKNTKVRIETINVNAKQAVEDL